MGGCGLAGGGSRHAIIHRAHTHTHTWPWRPLLYRLQSSQSNFLIERWSSGGDWGTPARCWSTGEAHCLAFRLEPCPTPPTQPPTPHTSGRTSTHKHWQLTGLLIWSSTPKMKLASVNVFFAVITAFPTPTPHQQPTHKPEMPSPPATTPSYSHLWLPQTRCGRSFNI